MQQHLDGPIHRKAVAHVEAERLRNERLGSQQGAAAAAVVRIPYGRFLSSTSCF